MSADYHGRQVLRRSRRPMMAAIAAVLCVGVVLSIVKYRAKPQSSDRGGGASANTKSTIQTRDTLWGDAVTFGILGRRDGAMEQFEPLDRTQRRDLLDPSKMPVKAQSGAVTSGGTVTGDAAELLTIRDALFAPDGRSLAAASGAGTLGGALTLWDLTVPSARAQTIEDAGLNGLAYAPDGREIAAASSDNSLKIYNAASGSVRAVLTGHTLPVEVVAYSPDGQTLASGGLDKTVRLWDRTLRAQRATLRSHTQWVVLTSFSVDGQTLSTVGRDAKMYVWHIVDAKPKTTVAIPAGNYESMALSRDGKRLATAGRDRTIRMWNTEQQRALYAIAIPWNRVPALAFSPDGTILASVNSSGSRWRDNEIKLWETATGNELRTLSGFKNRIQCLRFSPDGRTLACGCRDGTIRLWEVLTGNERLSLSVDGAGRPAESARTPSEHIRSPGEVVVFWEQLTSPDARIAYQAVGALVQSSGAALPLIEQRLRSSPKLTASDIQRIQQLLPSLVSDEYRLREAAALELRRIGPIAAPTLRRELEKKAPLVARRRIERLIEQLNLPANGPAHLQMIRALEVLELIGDADAARILRGLAEGAPQTHQTRAARASLERLTHRQADVR